MRLGDLELLRRRVLMAVAAGAALGCADRTVSDVESAGGSSGGETQPPMTTTSSDPTTPGNPSASASGPTTSPPPPTTTTTAGETTDGVRFDLPPPDVFPGPTPPEECSSPGGESLVCDYEPSSAETLVHFCMEMPQSGCAALENFEILSEGNTCLGSGGCADAFYNVACGPNAGVGGACCYWLVYREGQVCPGRPFVVDGSPRLGDVTGEPGWASPVQPDVAQLSLAERQALASAWSECALFEHASVASFSRFVLQLLAVGAPACLVERAQQALADELRHARLFFGLASAYAGHPVGPGPLAVDGSLDSANDLAAIVTAAIREGCIAETVSALQIASAADRASDPVVGSTLTRVAEEELRHAELAWAFVAWALEHGDAAVRHAVELAFQNPLAAVPHGPAIDARVAPSTYAAHGMLPPSDAAALADRALQTIVLPAATEVLSPCGSGRASPQPSAGLDPRQL